MFLDETRPSDYLTLKLWDVRSEAHTTVSSSWPVSRPLPGNELENPDVPLEVNGVCDNCLPLKIDRVLEEGKFQEEDEKIEKAIAELMKYLTDEPIRAAFREILTIGP
jgi:hypothetical protein